MNKVEEFAKDLDIISNYFKKRMNSINLNNCNIKDCMTIEALLTTNLSMLQLADILNLSPSATTTHIERLIESGIVVREYDNSDRRKVFIKLTKKGLSFGNLINIEHLDISKRLLKSLNKIEMENFTKIMKKIAKDLTEND